VTCNPYSIEAHNRDTPEDEKLRHQKLLDEHVTPQLARLMDSLLPGVRDDPFYTLKHSHFEWTCNVVKGALERKAQLLGCVIVNFNIDESFGPGWKWSFNTLWYTWQWAVGTEERLAKEALKEMAKNMPPSPKRGNLLSPWYDAMSDGMDDD
jgi:hypothetical protein